MAAAQSKFSTESSIKGPRALEVLDEAVSLLRQTPLATFSIYYLGALPFCLTLIYFWFDMIQGADAEAHLPGEAMALTAFYFWMKICQAVFARKLLALLEGEDSEPWTLQRLANTALLQVIYTGSFIIAYPTAIMITLPFGWVSAFYHNISIVGTGPKSTLASSYAEAAELARLWPKQNHLIIGMMLIAALLLYANLAVFCIMVPQLLNMLFGIETVFDEGTYAWNNSSFYLDVAVFCFLILNPLNKAIYALRCFYGRSRLNGADLKSALRRYYLARPGTTARTPAVALVLVLSLLCLSTPLRADDPVKTAPAAAVPQVEPAVTTLDQSIQKTLEKDEFSWRLPRIATHDDKEGWFVKMLRNCVNYMKHLFRAPAEWIAKIMKWFFSGQHKHDTSSSGWKSFADLPWKQLLVLFAIVVVLFLAYMLFRHFRRQTPIELAPVSVAQVRTVDLEAEDVRADDLPEDSWLSLAQQMIEKGELRLALRAFYLATLSVLAQQQLVRLAPAKSNRDYIVELARRLRGNTSVLEFFRENSTLFEASWYGTHAVTTVIIETMRANHHQVKTHAAP